MNFGVLVFPGVEELDFAGPWELLGMWRKYAQGPEQCMIVAQATAPVTCANGLVIVPHVAYADCPQLDYLLVPGGEGTDREENNPATISFIQKQSQGCQAVASVCTGAFLLHKSGLLAGRRATTHWNSLERLRALPDVTVVEDRYVHDGPVWTSAGVSAGTDLMLALIASIAGEKAAGKVQFSAEYYPSLKSYSGFHRHPKAAAYLRDLP